jgi:DegV family protein with EDD domain
MGQVRVVTDSACDLSEELADELDITVVPLTIRFGSEEFVDRRDLTPTSFWQRCASSSALPETAAPAPGAFQAAYEQARAEGADGVVCITISSDLSATFQSARAGGQALGEFPIAVIDSRSVTMGQGLVAVAVAEAARRGSAMPELTTIARDTSARITVLGAIATLEHLQRGGRIGAARAMLGSVLSIKPVVQVANGVVAEESKQRTRSRSLEYLSQKVHAAAPLERLAVCSGAAPDMDHFCRLLADVEVEQGMLVSDLGPVVGTHAGPGTIGVAFLPAV